MGEMKSRQDYAKYHSEALAVYKQVFLETHGESEADMKAAVQRLKRFGDRTSDIESGVADMVIDHDVLWNTVVERSVARDVSGGTLDRLYGIVCETASVQARHAGYEGLSSGMRSYISDEMFDQLYDEYDAQKD